MDEQTAEPKRFKPASGDGSFTREEWATYWSGLTDEERQRLRDKAQWEHMSLSAVAMGWGA